MTAQTFTIAAIPADGVGKEVVAAGREILDYLAEHWLDGSRSPGRSFPGAASTTTKPAR